jgi:hypothetical protein
MALIANGVIVFVGPIVIMRYFVECYYLTILLVFAGLMVVLPGKVSVPILVLLLSIHLPGNIKAFMETQPELRLIKIVESKQDPVNYMIVSPTRESRESLIYKDVHWHDSLAKRDDRCGRLGRCLYQTSKREGTFGKQGIA